MIYINQNWMVRKFGHIPIQNGESLQDFVFNLPRLVNFLSILLHFGKYFLKQYTSKLGNTTNLYITKCSHFSISDMISYMHLDWEQGAMFKIFISVAKIQHQRIQCIHPDLGVLKYVHKRSIVSEEIKAQLKLSELTKCQEQSIQQ